MVYIRTNFSNTTLYVGVTSNAMRRDIQHRMGTASAFTKRYKLTKLVWYRRYEDIRDAIREEKRLKAGSRQQKISLVEEINPTWEDLSKDWHS